MTARSASHRFPKHEQFPRRHANTADRHRWRHGFVGRHLCARLLAQGHRVTIFTRRSSGDLAARLAPAEVVEVDTESAEDCVNALTGHRALINLAGILHESSAQRFQSVHTELPVRLAQACTNAGVQHYLHMSALRADMKDPPSAYLRSKARGEKRVNAASESLAVDISGRRLFSARATISLDSSPACCVGCRCFRWCARARSSPQCGWMMWPRLLSACWQATLLRVSVVPTIFVARIPTRFVS